MNRILYKIQEQKRKRKWWNQREHFYSIEDLLLHFSFLIRCTLWAIFHWFRLFIVPFIAYVCLPFITTKHLMEKININKWMKRKDRIATIAFLWEDLTTFQIEYVFVVGCTIIDYFSFRLKFNQRNLHLKKNKFIFTWINRFVIAFHSK